MQGFVGFTLDRERETAPLLDAQLDLADARAEYVLRLISGKRAFDTNPLARIARLTGPLDTLTLAEMRQVADAPPAALQRLQRRQRPQPRLRSVASRL